MLVKSHGIELYNMILTSSSFYCT